MGSPNPKKYTAEFRRETADYVISTGRLVKQMTKELGINDNMLSN
jgi:transposase